MSTSNKGLFVGFLVYLISYEIDSRFLLFKTKPSEKHFEERWNGRVGKSKN